MTVKFDTVIARIVGIEGAIVYDILSSHFKRDNPYSCTIGDIVRYTDCLTKQQVTRAIESLLKHGLISRKETCTFNHAYEYKILM